MKHLNTRTLGFGQIICSTLKIRTCLLGLVAFAVPATALGQEREPFADAPQSPLLRPDVAGSRQPQFESPNAIVAGPLQLLPALRLRSGGDSNVTSTVTGNRGDTFVMFEPNLQVRSKGATTFAVVRANAALARDARLSDQNRNATGASSELRWQLASRAAATAKATVARAYSGGSSHGRNRTSSCPRLDSGEAAVKGALWNRSAM